MIINAGGLRAPRREKDMKVKTAWADFNCTTELTCYNDGERGLYGAAIWRDADGKAYTLQHTRRTKVYAFQRCPFYDDEKGEYRR